MTSGNSKEPNPNPGSGRWKNLLLLGVVSLATLWVADRIFIAYEQSQLVPRLPDINGEAPVNLEALRYNDGVVERQKGPGEFRILSFGDSFTYSVMDPQWSYNGVIQQSLQADKPKQTFRVVNLGEPATGTRHFRQAYEFWSQVFEHDAVLFHIFLGNDILDDAYIHASVVWEPNEAVFRGDNPILEAGNRRVPQKFPFRMLDYAFAWWMSARTQSNDLPEGYNWAGLTSFDEQTFDRINFKFLENFDPQKMKELLAGYEQVFYLLERAQEISETGTSVMVVLGPAEPQVDEELRNRAIEANGADAAAFDLKLAQSIITRLRDRIAPDVPLFDLSDVFIEESGRSGEKLYFRRNTHWNKAGNKLAGEAIAGSMQSIWFDEEGTTRPAVASTAKASLNQQEIDRYLAPLIGDSNAAAHRISGAVRAIQMFDGISGRNDNWAIAPLGQEILVELESPKFLATILLDLYRSDGRVYRFTVEGLSGEEWIMLADQSELAVGGSVLIPVDRELSAIRLVGLHNSRQEKNPDNTFIHIEEITLVE